MKPIKKYPGYFADEAGNIYTMRPRGFSHTWRTTPYRIAQNIQGKGYLGVGLMLNKVKYRELVHLIILTTFKGKKPSKKHQGCHGKGGKLDNSVGNIYWGTAKQNNFEDKIRDGTLRFGDNHGKSKLTCEKVKEIKTLFKKGVNNSSLADMFNVSHGCIHHIRCGHSWRHISV